MVRKCIKGQIRRLKTALRWKGHPEQRQRIQMVLLRESGMTQPSIAEAMGVSLSTVNRAHMAYDHGGLKALKRKPSGGRKRERLASAFWLRKRPCWRVLGEPRPPGRAKCSTSTLSRRPTKRPSGTRPATARSTIFWPGTAGVS